VPSVLSQYYQLWFEPLACSGRSVLYVICRTVIEYCQHITVVSLRPIRLVAVCLTWISSDSVTTILLTYISLLLHSVVMRN